MIQTVAPRNSDSIAVVFDFSFCRRLLAADASEMLAPGREDRLIILFPPPPAAAADLGCHAGVSRRRMRCASDCGCEPGLFDCLRGSEHGPIYGSGSKDQGWGCSWEYIISDRGRTRWSFLSLCLSLYLANNRYIGSLQRTKKKSRTSLPAEPDRRLDIHHHSSSPITKRASSRPPWASSRVVSCA